MAPFISALSQLYLSCAAAVPKLCFSCVAASFQLCRGFIPRWLKANSRLTHLLTHRYLTAISRPPRNTKKRHCWLAADQHDAARNTKTPLWSRPTEVARMCQQVALLAAREEASELTALGLPGARGSSCVRSLADVQFAPLGATQAHRTRARQRP